MSASADNIMFRQPVIRHLAWLCSAPRLYTGAQAFAPEDWLPDDYLQRLQEWDLYPAVWPESLRQQAPRRLGFYFEQLYACLLTDLLQWPILARNLQIRQERCTLGELDFLVLNPHTGAVEHHEIAVKFYLGHRNTTSGAVLWYGPNSRDRLDLKTAHLLQHQIRLPTLSPARCQLEALGIAQVPVPRIFMPGYLFQPMGSRVRMPQQVEPAVEAGHWCHAGEIPEQMEPGWIVLQKPHWLSAWHQLKAPEPDVLAPVAEQVLHSGRACMLARLRASGTCWREAERLFVVPGNWPAVPSIG